MRGGALLGSGESSCAVTSTYKYVNQESIEIFPCVFLISKDKDVANVEKEKQKILLLKPVLVKLNQQQFRYLSPFEIKSMTVGDLKTRYPDEYKDYVTCVGYKSSTPPDDTQVITIQIFLIRLYPFKNLHTNMEARAFLLESIRLLHSEGITHNDLHTGNIMAYIQPGTTKQIPIILDWGRAKYQSTQRDIDRGYKFFNKLFYIPSKKEIQQEEKLARKKEIDELRRERKIAIGFPIASDPENSSNYYTSSMEAYIKGKKISLPRGYFGPDLPVYGPEPLRVDPYEGTTEEEGEEGGDKKKRRLTEKIPVPGIEPGPKP